MTVSATSRPCTTAVRVFKHSQRGFLQKWLIVCELLRRATPRDARESVGLGEMMNFPSILSGTDHAHGEVAETLRAGKIVTGHYSLPETDRGLNAYAASGVRCCHESTTAEDALAKMRLGMYAQLRYYSAWKDLPVLGRGHYRTRHRHALRPAGE